MDQPISGSEALALLLPVIVPYVTAAIKKVWSLAMGRVPKWLGPFKAVVAGWMVAGLSRAVGVPLPTDLTQITDDTTTAILMSGVVIGAVGAWVRDLFDSLKKRFDEDSTIGKLVRLLAGGRETDLLSARGEVTVAAVGVVLLFSVVVSAMLRVHAQEAIERSRCEVEATLRHANQLNAPLDRQRECWERFGLYVPVR